MQMPLTAVVLVMEFTHMDHSYLAPTLLCAAGAFLTCRVLDRKRLMSRGESQRAVHPGSKISRIFP
jgi:H+/Cl- antiporter ClcA